VATVSIPGKPLSELTRRVLFGIVAAPLTVALIYLGGPWLGALCAAAAGLGAWEVYRLARATGIEPFDAIGIPVATLVPLVMALEPPGVFTLPIGPAALVVLVLLTAALIRGAHGRPLAAVAVTLFGIVYTGGLLSFGIGIRYHNYAVGRTAGTVLVLLPIILTWTNDIGAYMFGRLFGHRKLVPTISPGKTVAGAIGGTALTIIACWAYVRWVLHPLGELALAPWAIIVFGLAISITAQIGDLVESLLKREAGIKNSSELIPGHGGVLDRLDSLLFVLPVAYVLFNISGLLIPAPL
jgi:phosphatidate cytidylyltransferase